MSAAIIPLRRPEPGELRLPNRVVLALDDDVLRAMLRERGIDPDGQMEVRPDATMSQIIFRQSRS